MTANRIIKGRKTESKKCLLDFRRQIQRNWIDYDDLSDCLYLLMERLDALRIKVIDWRGESEDAKIRDLNSFAARLS